MKIAVLSKYSRLGASSRLRTLQYIPHLQNSGIKVQVLPLFDDTYLHAFYAGEGRSLNALLRYYFSRAKVLCNLKDVDLLLLEKEALPFIPFCLENVIMPSGIPYVVDYDDAIFHNYDLSESTAVRKILGCKIDKVMAKAAMVVCGNSYLKERAVNAGARYVEIVPTVVDISRYSPICTRVEKQVPAIGWIGSPTTQAYIRDIVPALRRVCSEVSGRLFLVGAQKEFKDELYNIHSEIIPWREDTEFEILCGFDIGIMPLQDGPWELGKCGYKLIQYMACGLPVVASPVGVNSEIVCHGTNGFLASTLQEWETALTQLLLSPDLRNRMGRMGRSLVEQKYTLQVQAEQWVKILTAVAG